MISCVFVLKRVLCSSDAFPRIPPQIRTAAPLGVSGCFPCWRTLFIRTVFILEEGETREAQISTFASLR